MELRLNCDAHAHEFNVCYTGHGWALRQFKMSYYTIEGFAALQALQAKTMQFLASPQSSAYRWSASLASTIPATSEELAASRVLSDQQACVKRGRVNLCV